MIKGVLSVKEYVTGIEDYMMYERGYYDAREKIFNCIREEPGAPK
jgi:hypothetical protein